VKGAHGRRTLASGVASAADLPGMFVAHNDEMALGVRQALRDFDSNAACRWAAPPSPAATDRRLLASA